SPDKPAIPRVGGRAASARPPTTTAQGGRCTSGRSVSTCRCNPRRSSRARDLISGTGDCAGACETPRRGGGPGQRIGMVEFLLPVCGSSFGGEVEHVPERFEGSDVAGVLTRVGAGVEELRAPEVPDCVLVAMKDGQHRSLRAVVELGVIVDVV